jgi:glycerol-3-phosphate dehydrogenase
MTEKMLSEFSFRTRKAAIERFERETFDLLIIGGGITGAAAARDAALRGLKVALVERTDFAEGTSSRSSKLIHGGLRYLENLEFGLVFEALAERAHLLKTAPHMVRPLPFYFPVYQGDRTPRFILRMGMWLYDILALFRAPGFHRGLSKRKMLSEIPFLSEKGLKGGFQYYDASMWDDVLVIETLRSAVTAGAAVANYVEAVSPIWNGDLVAGFKVRDLEGAGRELELRAKRVVVCAGPWTDEIGARISDNWRPWLNPSKGVHLVFDLKRIPIAGAMVMSHPEDGRISFVIPRPDLGAGVVIVGTTDSPSPKDPAQSTIDPQDVQYLLTMLQKYFPKLGLKASDILSAYVGVRPLMGSQVEAQPQGEGASSAAASLQKVSREHYIGPGPGGTVVVAGGKYTTHRKMAEEIIDFTLDHWKVDAQKGRGPEFVEPGPKRSELAVNPQATPQATAQARREAQSQGLSVPEQLWDRYGAEAVHIFKARQSAAKLVGEVSAEDPEGFPALEAQLRHAIRNEMVLHLDDFYLRRAPLYLARADHGLPWAKTLAKVWAEERGGQEADIAAELARLDREVAKSSAWTKDLA